MKKRVLSVLLCLCMALALLPAAVSAAAEEGSYDFSHFDFSNFTKEDYKNLALELMPATGRDPSRYTSEFYNWQAIAEEIMMELDENMAAEAEAAAHAKWVAEQLALKEASKKDVYTKAQADASWWKNNERELILTAAAGGNAVLQDLTSDDFSNITRLLLDYPGADPSYLIAGWINNYEGCFHNIKEVWLSPQVDAKEFFSALERADLYGDEGVFKKHSSGVLNGSLTIFVPDSQLPKGLLSYSSEPQEPTFAVKVYSGDVYAAYKQGASAGREWCPGHVYTGKVQTASRMYQHMTCQRPNLWYYSCKWCGKCEYNPNHTFSRDRDGKDTSKTFAAAHEWERFDLSDKNYIGTNERGEKVYCVSCIWCGITQREYDLNYTYAQHLKDMNAKDNAESKQSYQYYMKVMKESWAVGGSSYNAALKSSVDHYGLPIAFAVAGGKDVNAKMSVWAQDGVKWAAQNDLVDAALLGNDYTRPITRLQFCSVAVKMAEKMLGKAITPAPSGTFTDTDNEYVRKAYAAGITTGTSATTFGPDGTLSRQQMATFLYRALQYVKNNSDIRYTIYDSKLNSYTDAGQIQGWANEPMAFMNALGLITGTTNTTLAPNGNCTVEQALVVANRSLRADVIGWYQSLAGTETNVTDSGKGGNVHKNCFYSIPGDVSIGLRNQLRYLQSERFWVTGVARSRDWVTGAIQAQGDNIQFLEMLDPYTGNTLYIQACNFRPIKAD